MAAKTKPPHPRRAPAKEDDAPGGVSRRNFLKTVGATSAVAGIVRPMMGEAQGAPAVGPGEVPITLTINGTRRNLRVEPRMTLLDAVRNKLDVTGQKRVCDRGSCGACTMLVDGKAIYACSMLAIEAQGKTIRTVEGLTEATVLNPLQQAICDADGSMCGFCTPGFVMSATALLEKNPNPTLDQTRKALDGNICRCGTYAKLFEACLSPSAKPKPLGKRNEEVRRA
jgi:xanthine dehydrogenase YagT iron-sulfur-binding subunit